MCEKDGQGWVIRLEGGGFPLSGSVIFAVKSLEDRLHLGKTQIKFGFSLAYPYLCSRSMANTDYNLT